MLLKYTARLSNKITSSTYRHALNHLALVIGLGLGTLAGTTPVYADAPIQATHEFAIPDGSLDTALTRFGQQSGVLVSVSGDVSEGKQVQGLEGNYAIDQALELLLQGTDLQAVRQANGSYVITTGAGSQGAFTLLPTVRVEGVTEGSGSYTTGLTNTATKFDLSMQETPQSVTVVTRKRIEDQGLEEISDVLDQTVGLVFNNTGPLGADNNFIYSRGFPLQNYQVDGVPRSTRFGFQNDIADMAIFDRVEVVRGASGLLNGVGEPSGAVNLVRKLPTTDFQAYIAGKYGSWDHSRAEGDISGPLDDEGKIRGRFVTAYQDSDSFIDRINLQKDILYGVVEADVSDSTLVSVGVEYQDHETTGSGRFGAPIYFSDGTLTKFARSTNLAAEWGYHTRRNLTLFSSLDHYFDNDWRLEVDLERSEREYDSVMPALGTPLNPDGSGAELNARRWAGEPEQSSLNFHAIGPYTLFDRQHELVIGGTASYLEQDGLSYSGSTIELDNFYTFINNGKTDKLDVSATGAGSNAYEWQSGAYIATRLRPTDTVSIILGTRLSNWKTRTDRFTADGTETRGPTNKKDNETTPYAGIVFDIMDYLSVYASYTDIFQPSTRYDVNGELLEPAEGSNAEGGVKLAFFDDRLNISAVYYQTEKDNVAEYVPGPGGTLNYGPTGQYVYTGVDGTKTTGFELEISGQITPRWQVSGGFSHTDAKDKDGESRETEIPTDTFKLFTSYDATHLLEGLSVGANLRWQNEIFYDSVGPNGEPYKQDGFTLLDLMAQYAITDNLSATLNINNIFDKKYFTDLTSAYYGEPRSAYLTLRYNF